MSNSLASLREVADALRGRPYAIGDRVILLDDLETLERPYFAGHEFILESMEEWRWNVVDDNGNRIDRLGGKWFVLKEE